jgi:hypothetical protein
MLLCEQQAPLVIPSSRHPWSGINRSRRFVSLLAKVRINPALWAHSLTMGVVAMATNLFDNEGLLVSSWISLVSVEGTTVRPLCLISSRTFFGRKVARLKKDQQRGIPREISEICFKGDTLRIRFKVHLAAGQTEDIRILNLRVNRRYISEVPDQGPTRVYRKPRRFRCRRTCY